MDSWSGERELRVRHASTDDRRREGREEKTADSLERERTGSSKQQQTTKVPEKFGTNLD